ncbi:fibroblast growth factor receptor 4-like [Montipora foliosa]|uniref:fibroblast growth factor receptor 4-like n=1 Tax=Montipora foliosa TaxID=591990 RepID=UPI0035F164EE
MLPIRAVSLESVLFLFVIVHSEVGRPPKFRNPSNRSSEYTQGSPVRLKCHANGEAPLNITWLKDGSILSRADEKLLKSKGRVLNFHKLSSSQAGSYMCKVTNAFGTIVKTFDIKVVGVARPAEHAPRILKKGLKNETARPGDDATFVCSAISRGYPKFHFLKWKPPENVSNGSDPFDFVDFRKSKFREIREVAKPHMGSRRIYTHRLVIYNVTSADEAKYTCMVGNTAGWVNKHAFLAVDRKALHITAKEPGVPSTTNLPTQKGSVRPSSMPPLIVGRPPKFRNPSNRSSEYTQGSPIRLRCHANGEAPLNITWLKDGSILSRADEKLLKSKGRVLNFHKLSSSQAGSYMCIVTNAFGTIVKTFDIKVVGVAPPAEYAPRILKKGLKNETARPGDDATFVCSAISRGYPKFHFLKWKPPENVSNGSDPFDFVDFRKSKFREIREVAKPHMGSRRIYTHRLVIYNVTSADEAKYTCMVGNTAGWVNKHAFLTVDRKGKGTDVKMNGKKETSQGNLEDPHQDTTLITEKGL